MFGRVGVFSRGILRTSGVKTFLCADELVLEPSGAAADALDAVAGWGCKSSAQRAAAYAARHGVPLLRLEDGFLRSKGLAVAGAQPLSLIVDDVGIYYDTTRPSRVTNLLAGPSDGSPDPLDDATLLKRASHCMRRIGEAKLSKYNHAPDAPEHVGETTLAQRVLIVDQTLGDESVVYGGGDSATFEQMLQTAVDEHPHAEILVKTHPDVLAGKRRGYLGKVPEHPRITLLDMDVNARSLLERVDHVYTVTSQLGLEAIVAGKPVTVFGTPFYAGWGLTDDRTAMPHARRQRTVEQLFAAAYLLYPRYLDPVTGRLCDAETVIEYLALQRYWCAGNAGRLFCVGFQFWKHAFVRRFLAGEGNEVQFVRSAAQARRNGFDETCRLIVWGHREREDIRALADETGVALERMEDGFVRSFGLGSDMVAPLSLVLDHSGIYYDPTGPSDLETVLATTEFDSALRGRARLLRERLVELGISKYNFSHAAAVSLHGVGDKTVVLVPGQVEDDASVRLGGVAIRTNRALLEAVRAARPNAYIVYKPHPEVVSGNRKGRIAATSGRQLWDELVTDASIAECLKAANEVHTLTSLVGFEALLRGKHVVTYGRPFYAGWGLTEDLAPQTRRASKRQLGIDDLVAAALILYPRYIDPVTGTFTTAEVALERLHSMMNGQGGHWRLTQPRWMRQLLKMERLFKGVDYVRPRSVIAGADRAVLQSPRSGTEGRRP